MDQYDCCTLWDRACVIADEIFASSTTLTAVVSHYGGKRRTRRDVTMFKDLRKSDFANHSKDQTVSLKKMRIISPRLARIYIVTGMRPILLKIEGYNCSAMGGFAKETGNFAEGSSLR